MNTLKLTHEQIHAAGGIVHRDGNIFFTNIEKLNDAIAAIEAQGVPDGYALVSKGALQMVVNVLQRDAINGMRVRGEIVEQLLASAPPAPQAEPILPSDVETDCEPAPQEVVEHQSPAPQTGHLRAEAQKLSKILAGMGEGGYDLETLYTTDQADGDAFVRRAADLLVELASALPAPQAKQTSVVQPVPVIESDMFWDHKDPEEFGHDIGDIVCNYGPGDKVKIDCAFRMQTITVLVKEGCDYEIVSGSVTHPAPQAIPPELDVRTILLAIEPRADGTGEEVYAKSVADVEAKLTALDQELEEWQLGIKRLPAPQASIEQQEPANVRGRWNIELDGDDLLVCFNDHEKGESCSYQRYVPAQQAKPLTHEQKWEMWDSSHH